MYKGLAKDDLTLNYLNIKNGDKLMLIGSKPQDIESVINKPVAQPHSKTELHINKKEMFCNETAHKKVLEKYGKPDDCMPGILNMKVFNLLKQMKHLARLLVAF
jgi:hypothetical protein